MRYNIMGSYYFLRRSIGDPNEEVKINYVITKNYRSYDLFPATNPNLMAMYVQTKMKLSTEEMFVTFFSAVSS